MILIYILIGFFAELIDGSLGMAYGVSCRTFLRIFLKAPTGVISAIVHYAELPSSFVSMISHLKYKNVLRNLFINLTIGGVIGSIIGSYLVTLNFSWIEILVDVYLIIVGFIILRKSFSNKKSNNKYDNKIFSRLLGFIGAFFDSSGGGGYGPIATGSLISTSDNPQKIIGTVNSSEFFITLSSSITFFLIINSVTEYLYIIIGLIIGSVLAAPLAAKICLKIKPKYLYFLVGFLLIVLNVYNIFNYFV